MPKWRSTVQEDEITAINGNTITVKDPLNIDFPLSLIPQIWRTVPINTASIPVGNRWDGLENIRVAGGNKAHVRQPVAENPPERFRARGVAVHDDRKEPAGEMARIVPSFELHFFGALGIFAAGERRVGVAAIGADEAIDHEL